MTGSGLTSYAENRARTLPKVSPYRAEVVLRDDEELVEFRHAVRKGGRRYIKLCPGELVIFDSEERGGYVGNGRCVIGGNGEGRYVVRKRVETGVFTVSSFSVPQMTFSNQTTTEVEIVSDQTLSFKRTTLLKALKDRKSELEKQDKEKEQDAQDEVAELRDQLVALLEAYPAFVKDVKAAIISRGSYGSEPGTKDFVQAVDSHMKSYAGFPGFPHPDHETLDRLIRMYDAAEDAQVELSVTDQVVKFL